MSQQLVVSEAFPAPGVGPAGLAWDGKTLWHADYRAGQIFGLDSQNGSIRKKLYCPGNLSGLAWDGRSLWQSLFDQEMIRCINPDTNDFDETVILSGQGWLSGVAWDGRKLWVVAQQYGRLLSIDLTTNETYPPVNALVAIGDIDYRDDYLWASVASPMEFDNRLGRFNWLSASPEYAIVQIDPHDGRVHAQYPADSLYSGLCWVGESLYMSHAVSRMILTARLQ